VHPSFSSAPSKLYDYYNPEAAASVGPVKFSVHQAMREDLKREPVVIPREE
jgi:hypothetical protein